jgi:uncharacterized protein (DUF1499 family)
MRVPRVLKWALPALFVVLASVAAGIALYAMTAEGETLLSWKRPDNLGVHEGKLAACKRTPNCVSSQADLADAIHYVAPIPFHGNAQDAIAEVRATVENMERVRVIREMPAYLYAEFRSRLMGFVDDVEFVFDEKAQLLHVRSASRLGRRDFGVNRERVERIRATLLARSHAAAAGEPAAP